jgi:hypothetical protein
LKAMKFIGIAVVVLAIAIAVVPHFTDCQSQGMLSALANGNKVPMKCHWAGIAEIGAAIPMAAVGIMMVFSRRKESMAYLSLSVIVLGGVVLALPDVLIGTCPTLTHACNTMMKPALNGLGSLAIVTAAVGLVLSLRTKDLA